MIRLDSPEQLRLGRGAWRHIWMSKTQRSAKRENPRISPGGIYSVVGNLDDKNASESRAE